MIPEDRPTAAIPAQRGDDAPAAGQALSRIATLTELLTGTGFTVEESIGDDGEAPS